MFVERQTIISKKGRYRELQKLLDDWSRDFKFPRATSVRHFFTYIGQDYSALCLEWEFESLGDLQSAWQEWEEMSEEMAAYRGKFEELVDQQQGPELWRVKRVQ